MSHVEFKKWPCHPVEFRGQEPPQLPLVCTRYRFTSTERGNNIRHLIEGGISIHGSFCCVVSIRISIITLLEFRPSSALSEFRRDACQKPEGILELLVCKLLLLYGVVFFMAFIALNTIYRAFVERRSRQSVCSHQ